MEQAPYVGQRISFTGAICTVRYVGPVTGTAGSWLGVEWDDATRGKHDGSHQGVRYFTCNSRPSSFGPPARAIRVSRFILTCVGLSRSSSAGSFVRPTRPADRPRSFLAALREKYAPEPPTAGGDGDCDGSSGAASVTQIVISGKVAEEMGFDKVRRRLARLDGLRLVVLDGMCIASATVQPGEPSIAATCPRLAQLDLSRNLFECLSPVVHVCAELPALRRLSLNGNRFQTVMDDETLELAATAFRGVDELALGDTLLGWDELCRIAAQCPSLMTLAVGTNQLSSLPSVYYGSLVSTLTSINLEFNDFMSVSDLASLASLQALRNLLLKGNKISVVAAPGTAAPIFPLSLQYLDVSYNNIQKWSFVDALSIHFPGLTGLRITHNPVYDTEDANFKPSSSDESHMFTIGRLANLKTINFTQIKSDDRRNAEMFYLSRIAKQLASVPEAAEQSVLALHPRYVDLCVAYGAPDIIRRHEVNPSFLEARLIKVCFHCPGKGEKSSRIPRAFNVYSVQGIAGKLFDLSPLQLHLYWETDEWDPIASYDEQDGESSDEADETFACAPSLGQNGQHQGNHTMSRAGQWIKREVELKDGPKQLGYCVDGMDVRIRVEPV